MSTLKPPKLSLIMEGFQHFGAIILILSSGLCLSGFGLTALILAECALIVFRGIELFFFEYEGIKYNKKRFLRAVVPCAAVIIVVAVLGAFIKNDTVSNVIGFITKAAAVVFVFPLIIPIYSNDRYNDKSIVRSHKLTTVQKVLYKLFSIFYRIFVISGLVLTIVAKPFLEFYFEGLVIAGCVLWCCLESLKLYCWWNCELITENSYQEQEYDDSEADEIFYQSGSDNNGERVLNDHDVYLKVKKIADRWSYREEHISCLTEGLIRYNVSFEVTGFDRINYTINGKLSLVSDISNAITLVKSQMDKAGFKIKEETKRELEDCNLPHSYEINVDIGYIE